MIGIMEFIRVICVHVGTVGNETPAAGMTDIRIEIGTLSVSRRLDINRLSVLLVLR